MASLMPQPKPKHDLCKLSHYGITYRPHILDKFFTRKFLDSKEWTKHTALLPQGYLHVFFVTPFPPVSPYCPGLVKRIEFCYAAFASSFDTKQDVFELHYLIKYGGYFVAMKKVKIFSIPSSRICSSSSSTLLMCCDHQLLPKGVLTQTFRQLFYGILPLIPHVLYHTGLPSQFNYVSIKVNPDSKLLKFGIKDGNLQLNSSFPLIRFKLIGMLFV